MSQNSQSPSVLKTIVEAPLIQLVELRYQSANFSDIETYYIEVLLRYFKGEVDSLKDYLKSQSQNEVTSFGMVRLMTLECEIKEEVIDQFILQFENSSLSTNPVWQAECFYVAAQALQAIEKNKKASEFYKKAYVLFTQEKVLIKASKSLLNHLAVEARLYPDKTLASDYYFLAKKAKALGEDNIVGVCFLNLSREYQILGAKETALEYINKAISHLESDFGSKHYFLCLAQRAHVYIDLGRLIEAKKDYDHIVASKHPALIENIKVIDKLMGDKKFLEEKKLTSSWREKLQQLEIETSRTPLTHFESKLIEILLESPKKKEDLVSALYGDQVDYLSANNRFKVLLSRLRKKRPNMIVSNSGLYKISDQVSGQNLEREQYA